MSFEAQTEKHRILHLDSLRGIAALCVSLTHSIQCINGIPYQVYLNNILGQSSVVFFFLLSGFVLGKSLNKDLSPIGITSYYVRRILRLYPAALAAIVFGYLAARYYPETSNLDYSSPFIKEWMAKAQNVHGPGDILNALFLQSKAQFLNSPLWTIKVEFICSFLFPLLLVLINFSPKARFIIVVALIVLMSRGIDYGSRFLFAFYLGNLIGSLALSLSNLSESFTKWSLFLLLTLWLFSIKYGFDPVAESIVLGSALAILIPCNWCFLKRILNSRPLMFMGGISYSFYLLHCPILFLTWTALTTKNTSVRLLRHPEISALLLFMISVLLTIASAWICEKLIEKPFNQLGHRISRRISNLLNGKRQLGMQA